MKTIAPVLYIIGASLTGAALAVYMHYPALSPYALIAAGLLIAAAQYISDDTPKDIILRRLYLQRQISHLLISVTGGLMLWLHHNEWIIAITIAAVIQLYTAFRIPALEKRQQEMAGETNSRRIK